MQQKKPTSKTRRLLRVINLPEILLNRLIGKEHPIFLRLSLGFAIMLLGSFIARHFQNEFCETCGGLIHATGAIPYLDFFILIAEVDPKDIEKDEKEIETKL